MWATNAVAPVVYYQPKAATNFVGDAVTLTSVASGQGLGSLTYQWQRCTTSSPSTCSPISGATTNQYVVTSADQGHYLAVYVVGHNDGTQLTSSLSQLVAVSTG